MLEGQAATEEVIINWVYCFQVLLVSKAIKAAALEAIQEAEEAGSGSQNDTIFMVPFNLPLCRFLLWRVKQVESSD